MPRFVREFLKKFKRPGCPVGYLSDLALPRSLLELNLHKNPVRHSRHIWPLVGLQNLNVSRIRLVKLERIAQLRELRTLNIAGSRVSTLEGLQALRNLTDRLIAAYQTSLPSGIFC